MRWKPDQDGLICEANTEGGIHVADPDGIVENNVHCHPRMKGTCTFCGQTLYTIAMDKAHFAGWYTMPPEVWSSRGISEALRTQKQWTPKKARV